MLQPDDDPNAPRPEDDDETLRRKLLAGRHEVSRQKMAVMIQDQAFLAEVRKTAAAEREQKKRGHLRPVPNKPTWLKTGEFEAVLAVVDGRVVVKPAFDTLEGIGPVKPHDIARPEPVRASPAQLPSAPSDGTSRAAPPKERVLTERMAAHPGTSAPGAYAPPAAPADRDAMQALAMAETQAQPAAEERAAPHERRSPWPVAVVLALLVTVALVALMHRAPEVVAPASSATVSGSTAPARSATTPPILASATATTAMPTAAAPVPSSEPTDAPSSVVSPPKPPRPSKTGTSPLPTRVPATSAPPPQPTPATPPWVQ
jgi:hypothetical protein